MNRIKHWFAIGITDLTLFQAFLIGALVSLFSSLFKALGFGSNLLTWTVSSLLVLVVQTTIRVYQHNRQPVPEKE
jgi:hypothetical protein